MTLSSLGRRQVAIVRLSRPSFSALSSTSSFPSARAQQMCTGDAFRLCSSDIRTFPAVTDCMKGTGPSLSTVPSRDGEGDGAQSARSLPSNSDK